MTLIVCISHSKPSEKRGHFVRLIEVGMHIVMNDGALQLSMLVSRLPSIYGCTQEVGKHERSVRVARATFPS